MPAPPKAQRRTGWQPPAAAEHAALRGRLQKLGLTAAQCDAAVGAAPGGKTRRQIAQALCAWLKTRPHA